MKNFYQLRMQHRRTIVFRFFSWLLSSEYILFHRNNYICTYRDVRNVKRYLEMLSSQEHTPDNARLLRLSTVILDQAFNSLEALDE